MKNKIVFVIFAFLSYQSFALDFEENSILKQAERRGLFDSSAEIDAKRFDEQTCTNQLNLFSNALANREFWALRRESRFYLLMSEILKSLILSVFDTWAKIESGYLSTNIFSMGHLTDCLRFRHETTSGNIRGQHCLLTVVPTANSTITPENPRDPNSRFDWREL